MGAHPLGEESELLASELSLQPVGGGAGRAAAMLHGSRREAQRTAIVWVLLGPLPFWSRAPGLDAEELPKDLFFSKETRLLQVGLECLQSAPLPLWRSKYGSACACMYVRVHVRVRVRANA